MKRTGLSKTDYNLDRILNKINSSYSKSLISNRGLFWKFILLKTIFFECMLSLGIMLERKRELKDDDIVLMQ